MGLRNPQEIGTRRPTIVRTGTELVPRWRGMYRQGGRGMCPINRFEHLENVRLSGGQVVSRGGQSSASDDTLTGCVIGIHDAGPDPSGGGGGGFIYFSGGFGDFYAYSEAGGMVQIVTGTTGPNATLVRQVCAFRGSIYYVVEKLPYYSHAPLMTTVTELWHITPNGSATVVPVFDVNLALSVDDKAGNGGMAVLNDTLYLLSKGSLVDGSYTMIQPPKLYSWDGASLTLVASYAGLLFACADFLLPTAPAGCPASFLAAADGDIFAIGISEAIIDGNPSGIGNSGDLALGTATIVKGTSAPAIVYQSSFTSGFLPFLIPNPALMAGFSNVDNVLGTTLYTAQQRFVDRSSPPYGKFGPFEVLAWNGATFVVDHSIALNVDVADDPAHSYLNRSGCWAPVAVGTAVYFPYVDETLTPPVLKFAKGPSSWDDARCDPTGGANAQLTAGATIKVRTNIQILTLGTKIYALVPTNVHGGVVGDIGVPGDVLLYGIERASETTAPWPLIHTFADLNAEAAASAGVFPQTIAVRAVTL